MSATTTATASWGVTAGSPVTGVITSYSKTTRAITAPEQNEVGAVIGQCHYDSETTVRVTVQVAASTNPPDEGDQVTIGGTGYYVEDAEIAESNTDYRKISITAKKYTNCDETHTP